ncbi:hypothetical protein P40081_15250 [Paenibacillus sp. FSL P4-0081]|uniref:hypothetical protein n=1 Tax=Paenibacillus sp. FSL P4-0081 TaxID=1536769 RepID=UPI0004F668FC|nr:hypothetical protein [Paenibacillus sp. FSL P4-0081]AIQ29354.1 hypothetical protein P40081_15250 [Paenibacillus sp. FSL P4-0081]
MRSLEKPKELATEAFGTCISRVRSSELKERLEECYPDIELAENRFEKLVQSALLHTFKDDLLNVRRVNQEEMEAVYTQRMVDEDSPGRDIYDRIKNAPYNSTCPICGQRKVTCLDHHLPKSLYPSLVVTPINLVPACDECNETKRAKIAKSSEDETIHPYFDDLGDVRYLFAQVVRKEEGRPPAFSFYFKAAPAWSAQLTARVTNHFDSFSLNELYRIHAADEISGQVGDWSKLGYASLKNKLDEQFWTRYEEHPNSWQTAFYDGVRNDEWFCNGGFLEFLNPVRKKLYVERMKIAATLEKLSE